MTIEQKKGKFTLIGVQARRVSIWVSDFPELLARHCLEDPTTHCIERFGKQYIADEYPLRQTEYFVRAVCKWDNDNRIGFKVLRDNDLGSIRNHFRNAQWAMLERKPLGAIKEITKIKGLGISFGSKHLKFLNPSRAVVLDSIIRDKIGYSNTSKGFCSFLNDCFVIRDHLNFYRIAASATRKRWRVSDVEMAIFISVRNS